MSPRRHADDDSGGSGLADALARWDIAQDWMRAGDDAPPDPGGWRDPADQPAGGAPPDGFGALPSMPPVLPEAAAAQVAPGGSPVLPPTTPPGPDADVRPGVAPGSAAAAGEPPPPTWTPPPDRPAEPNERQRLPWAAQNPPPDRWRYRPGLHEPWSAPVASTHLPASTGGQLPPPPVAPESWDAILPEEPSHSAKEMQLMSTSAPGGEANQPREPQPHVPGGEQSSVDPGPPAPPGPDVREQEGPTPPARYEAGNRPPGPAFASLPWESEPPRRQPAEPAGEVGPTEPAAPTGPTGPAGPTGLAGPAAPAAPTEAVGPDGSRRRPDEPTELMQPPATQAPPWESPQWGGSPAQDGPPPTDDATRTERSTGAQPAVGTTGADQPPATRSAASGSPATDPPSPAPAVAGTGPNQAIGAEPPGAGQSGWPVQPVPPGQPGQFGQFGQFGQPVQPGAGSPGAPSGRQPAGPPMVAPGSAPGMGWPQQAQQPQPQQPPQQQSPPGWPTGTGPASGAPGGGGEQSQPKDQSVQPWAGATGPPQAPPAPPPHPGYQPGWAGQHAGGTRAGYDPRWSGAQPPAADVPVWAPPGERGAPTVEDLTAQSLIRQRRRAPQTGWRKALYTLSAHSVNPGEAPSDVRRRELMERATVPVRGCYRIAVISLKGGVGKTTMTVCLGATLASLRGDRVIAVDANPDRGTLSGKLPLETVATVRNLLNDADRIGRYSDVRRYTSQSPDRLEVLASESDPAVSIAFSEQDYRVVAGILERFYNVVLTDCGTGLLHSAMSGVLALANQLVVVSSGSVDGARSASATLDWLEAHGHRSLVAGSVAVINSVRPKSGGVDLDKLHEHFAARCRSVVRVPYDPHLEEGAEVDLSALREETRYALLELAAYTADGFPRDASLAPRSMPEQSRPHQPQLP